MRATVVSLSRVPQARPCVRAPSAARTNIRTSMTTSSSSTRYRCAPAFATPDSFDDESLFAVEVDAVNQGHGVCDSQLLLRRKGTSERMLVLLGAGADSLFSRTESNKDSLSFPPQLPLPPSKNAHHKNPEKQNKTKINNHHQRLRRRRGPPRRPQQRSWPSPGTPRRLRLGAFGPGSEGRASGHLRPGR